LPHREPAQSLSAISGFAERSLQGVLSLSAVKVSAIRENLTVMPVVPPVLTGCEYGVSLRQVGERRKMGKRHLSFVICQLSKGVAATANPRTMDNSQMTKDTYLAFC
jgi:hypothetical protein